MSLKRGDVIHTKYKDPNSYDWSQGVVIVLQTSPNSTTVMDKAGRIFNTNPPTAYKDLDNVEFLLQTQEHLTRLIELFEDTFMHKESAVFVSNVTKLQEQLKDTALDGKLDSVTALTAHMSDERVIDIFTLSDAVRQIRAQSVLHFHTMKMALQRVNIDLQAKVIEYEKKLQGESLEH